jgi:hypothetical protein
MKTDTGRHSPDEGEPDFLRINPGLACLRAQLERVNKEIESHERFKEQLAEAEKQLRQLQESKSTSTKSAASKSNDGESETEEWETHYDDQVGAEYYYNPKTREASWLPPKYFIKPK